MSALASPSPTMPASPAPPLAANAAADWRRRLAYGALGLPLAMAALPVYVHVPRLWAEVSGISLALLGGLLLASRLLDAFVDPLLGAWSDRAAGRRRLIVLALPFLAAGFCALLMPPADGPAVPWLLAALLATYFGFSLASIAYQAWGAEIGASAGERTRLVASREAFGLVGVMLAAALPGLLATPGSPPGAGLAMLAWLFVPLLFLLASVSLLGAAPATAAAAPPASAAPALRAGLLRPLADARFRRLLGVYVANGIAASLPATLVLFFVADVLHAEQWSGAFLALYFVSGVVFLPLWVALARRIGRVVTWVLAMAAACLAFAGAAALAAGDVWPFALVCLLSGAALGADLCLPAALLAEISQGKAQGTAADAGGYFGWWNLVGKLNLALAAGLALPLLEFTGYRPGGAAGEVSSVAGLILIYCGLPIVFKTVAAALAWRWRHLLEEEES